MDDKAITTVIIVIGIILALIILSKSRNNITIEIALKNIALKINTKKKNS